MKCIVSQNEKKGIWVNPRRKAELFELCEMNAKKIIKTGVGIGSAFPNVLERGGASMGRTPLKQSIFVVKLVLV